MPSWKEILEEVHSSGGVYDIVRRRYLQNLTDYTGRNVIIYYSAWLQKKDLLRKGISGFDINDEDMNGFMATVHKLDRSKGLDLILHTPGGEISATESIVDYLRTMFNNDIRAFVPEIAMSAGTMVACACKEIYMGKHSSIGPIDPQLNGIPAHGIKEEFTRACREAKADPMCIPLWQPIIAKYSPTVIGECEKAIQMSDEIVEKWLKTGMFSGDPEASTKSKRIISELGDHSLTLTHSRHISAEKAASMGLKVLMLEDDQALQEHVLSVHHICMQTLTASPAIKLIENHLGVAFIKVFELRS